jgi:hypothetical protein
MAKPKKTPRELAEIIAAETPLDGVSLHIFTDDPTGWYGTVYGPFPSRVAQVQTEVNQIVQRLHVDYDLDESRP